LTVFAITEQNQVKLMICFRTRIHIAKILMGLLVMLMLLPIRVQAQSSVVYGVFFYSPTCPHCHDVMTNHWPSIRNEFGDQLQVLFIDVTQPEGSQLMSTALRAMHIPSNGVPMLIIGTDVLVGSIDIPQRAPDVIRAGLSSGGISYPPIPGIEVLFQSLLSETVSMATGSEQSSLLDEPANLAALIVLLGLITGIGIMGSAGWNLATRRNRHLIDTINGLLGRPMAFIGAMMGIGLAGSLVLGSLENPNILLISSIILAAFTVLAFHLFRSSSMEELSNWLPPLMVVAGLLVAGYLAYVEMALVEATCGVLGDCNAVQESLYAHVLGIPIGIIGVLGYLTILSLWLVNRYKNQRGIDLALFVIALLGVGFSIYLTFLEPFVIGASCVWCLISAVVMGILLWMLAPAGWEAVCVMQHFDERKKSL
jgi:uncharacterized membrane protein